MKYIVKHTQADLISINNIIDIRLIEVLSSIDPCENANTPFATMYTIVYTIMHNINFKNVFTIFSLLLKSMLKLRILSIYFFDSKNLRLTSGCKRRFFMPD